MKTPTYERVRELLTYDYHTGFFYWSQKAARRLLGTRAGHYVYKSHRKIKTPGKIQIDGKLYNMSHLAILWMTRAWPTGQVTFRDGDFHNNSFNNLIVTDKPIPKPPGKVKKDSKECIVNGCTNRVEQEGPHCAHHYFTLPEGELRKGWEAESGQKFDQDKPRMDLLDAYATEELAKVLTFGAKKYAPHNWRKGIGYARLIAAALRHIYAFARGEDIDEETGLSHMAHAMCCCMFLIWMHQSRRSFDDRWRMDIHIGMTPGEANPCS